MIDIADMLEVRLSKPEKFLIIRETLTRVGVPDSDSNVLYQSCHILHKRGRYYIVHFKELFALDGKPNNLTEDDLARRNTIAKLLGEWDLVELVKPVDGPLAPIGSIKIIAARDKPSWQLVPKYQIGKKKERA